MIYLKKYDKFSLNLSMPFKENLLSFIGKFQSGNFPKIYPLDYFIPVYHTVSNEKQPHLQHIINYKNEKQFERDLDEISKHFQWVTWQEFKDFKKGNYQPQKKIALLTFDDGLSQFHDIVVPILERKGIYAMNFINPKFIDNHDLMYRCKASLIIDKIYKTNLSKFDFGNISKDALIQTVHSIPFESKNELDEIAMKLEIDFIEFLRKHQPYMTLENLKSLTDKGFGISNHGFDHPLYHQLNLNEQIKNTFEAFYYLKENNFISESFAFPFTDFGVKREFFSQIFEEKNLFCSFGSAGLKLDDFEQHLQRIPMENGKNAAQILKEEIAYFNLKKILNKNTIHRK